jgi:ankyrin repeat protein
MLDRGANINLCDARGDSPLHLIARNRAADDDLVRLAVGRGARVTATNLRSETPLHAAMMRQQHDHTRWDEVSVILLAETLVALGADITARTADGSTPLHLAAENTELEDDDIQRLIALGADPSAADAVGRLPLHRHILGGRCHWLWRDRLCQGVRLADDPYLDALPRYHWNKVWLPGRTSDDDPAAEAVELAKLLARYPGILTARDVAGWSALHWAAVTGQDTVLLALLEAGADVNAAATDGVTPLAAVAGSPVGQLSTVRLLLDHGADVRRHRADGTSVLHAAIRCRPKQQELVALLIQHGADVNARDAAGDEPLHVALRTRASLPVLRLLLEAGADARAKDAQGRTPMDLADVTRAKNLGGFGSFIFPGSPTAHDPTLDLIRRHAEKP